MSLEKLKEVNFQLSDSDMQLTNDELAELEASVDDRNHQSKLSLEIMEKLFKWPADGM